MTNKYDVEKMQCSMGFEEQENGKWRFNITFFFPDTEEDTFDADKPLIDKFNYFQSKSEFTSDMESSLFGSLLSDALRHAMVDRRDVNYGLTMLDAACEKVPCPQDLKDEIQEHYDLHGDAAEVLNPDDPIGMSEGDEEDDEGPLLN